MRLKKMEIILLLYFISNLSNFAQSVQTYINKGDSLANIEYNYNDALDYYYLALVLAPNNSTVLNKISKTTVAIGDYLNKSLKDIQDEYRFGNEFGKETLTSKEVKSAQLDNYEKALEIANKSIQVDPQNAEGYVRRAIANARKAMSQGIFTVSSIVNKVKEDLEFAIALGTGGVDIQAVAHYVLARTHDEVSDKWAPARKIIGLGWGDIKVALTEYAKAIRLKSDVIMFYLDFAKALLEEDEVDKAISLLEKIDNCKIYEPQDEKRIKEAKELLTELK